MNFTNYERILASELLIVKKPRLKEKPVGALRESPMLTAETD